MAYNRSAQGMNYDRLSLAYSALAQKCKQRETEPMLDVLWAKLGKTGVQGTLEFKFEGTDQHHIGTWFLSDDGHGEAFSSTGGGGAWCIPGISETTDARFASELILYTLRLKALNA